MKNLILLLGITWVVMVGTIYVLDKKSEDEFNKTAYKCNLNGGIMTPTAKHGSFTNYACAYVKTTCK